jgi:hypothetical protein
MGVGNKHFFLSQEAPNRQYTRGVQAPAHRQKININTRIAKGLRQFTLTTSQAQRDPVGPLVHERELPQQLGFYTTNAHRVVKTHHMRPGIVC